MGIFNNMLQPVLLLFAENKPLNLRKVSECRKTRFNINNLLLLFPEMRIVVYFIPRVM